nr:hypothetical protein [Oceanococcus sp. HetDA_MAG_MS8]
MSAQGRPTTPGASACCIAPAMMIALTMTLASCDSAITNEATSVPSQNGESLRPPDLPGTAPNRPKLPLGAACGWQIVSDIDTVNLFYPDESALYWVALLPKIPGTRIRLDGRFGHMRYFSFNIYDPGLRPMDALADVELVPEGGHTNPFVEQTAPLGGSYVAYVEYSDAPDNPAPNTMYGGSFPTGPASVSNELGTAIFYRSYVPENGYDFDGGVGLPIITIETNDGSQEVVPFADCDEPLVPNAGGLVSLELNELILSLDPPDELLGLINYPTAVNPPKTQVFYDLPSLLIQYTANVLGTPISNDPTGLPLTGGGGLMSNQHNSYTITEFSRFFGSTFLVRGRAPTWRGAPGVPWGQEQLRYWSACQEEHLTQRFVACARDDQMAIDEFGFFTVMVSDAADRPAWATAENGITWLPYGPYNNSWFLYRHMLPNDGFVETVSMVPQGTAPADIMGDYLPTGAYCYADQLASPPESAAALFEDCMQATLSNGEQTGLLPSLLPPGR